MATGTNESAKVELNEFVTVDVCASLVPTESLVQGEDEAHALEVEDQFISHLDMLPGTSVSPFIDPWTTPSPTLPTGLVIRK